ncbi:hypothetical protein NEF87_002948 [Candidatus Lokiarchaeum ossiferum]|uniref:Uncharacterized protein n=1 Tax=Candidatus Lokiarchaeum ossiferum TaxID=2951803 RepID=A0ABY6HT23_9ARCH|nr:hypothetical protein NEF87_002948 [Candidatus Lokiarchaeum sp. B-35]
MKNNLPIEQSGAVLLMAAVKKIYPSARIVKCDVDRKNKFSYDFEVKSLLNNHDLEIVEEIMQEMIRRDLRIKQFPILHEEARLIFHQEPYRLKEIYASPYKKPIVSLLDGEVDLAQKPCIDKVGEISSVSIDKNQSLDPISMHDNYYHQRIYGLIS